ncbi:sodium/potassium/calcium exchanger 6-like [Tropilaelaps mercedesae]|uniref:Sodium/potassium/calcium exchanger 6-like n=1 Tax=Tropilaelaps mercedesae TaxID=418985 RepID=A0A1V9XUT2_9ACAR|nr:sodium/potassium/calcium exchanger 6-like [Tropilaelaps mercedesae]
MEDVAWLFGTELAGSPNQNDSRCSDVWEVATPDRCTFALTVSDCRSGDALLDYVELLYCRWDSLPVSTLLPLIGLFVLCGGLVCALAGGFVSPALVMLKDRFKLDEAKAGATLLTLGNGLPDIMGAVAAVQMGHEGLVVGEVLGGTLFVVGVIVGALYTVGGRAPLGRGFRGMLAFFGVAVIYVGHIYASGVVTGFHIAIGAGTYIAYYIYIFSLPSERERYEMIFDDTLEVNEETPLLKSEKCCNSDGGTLIAAIPPLLKSEANSNGPVCYVFVNDRKNDETRIWSFWTASFSCLETLYEVLAYMFQLPFKLLVPSVPDMEFHLDRDLSSQHTSHSLLSDGSSFPDCKVLVCFDWNQPRFLLFPWLLIAASGLAPANDIALFALLGVLSLLVYRGMFCVLTRPVAETLVTFTGFVLSLCFLHRLTAELVAVVRAMGLCTKLTDEVMGLSILTYGNFVGDISTYIAIVNRGCLQMALTGCISSALMALLFNISLAFSLRLATKGVWLCPLTRSTVTTVLMGAVAMCPVLLALSAVSSKCHSSATSGFCLLCYYAGIMVLLVYTQL